MAAPVKVNLKAYSARSGVYEIPLSGTGKVFKPVNAISKSAPAKVAVLKHGIPNTWQVKISDVRGMKEINGTSYYTARVLSPDVFELVDVNSNSFGEYAGGGTLEYPLPLDLNGFVPRFEIRKGTEVMLEAAAVLNILNNSVQLYLSPNQTASLSSAFYTLRVDLVKDSLVLPVVIGSITVMKE